MKESPKVSILGGPHHYENMPYTLMEQLKAIDQPKVQKKLATRFPLTYKAFFSHRYILPAYRQLDYANQKWQNIIDYDRLLRFASGNAPEGDEPWMIILSNVVAALNYNRPTLFLERELGEALLRTNILEHLTTGDIHWRWPAFRIYLPSNLISIHRNGEPKWATHFDVAEIGLDTRHSCPSAIAQELDTYYGTNRLQHTDLCYKEHGLCITTALNEPESAELVQTSYAQLKPWGQITLTQYFAVKDELKGGATQDSADHTFLRKLEHLVLNVLLFLSELPAEYPVEHRDDIIRHGNSTPSKLQSTLLRARFVGDLSVRRMAEVTRATHAPTGRHTTSHWVSGHWRNQPHGPALSLRKLIWILPYRTHETT